MKRAKSLIALVLALVMCVALFGCGSKTTTTTTTSDTATGGTINIHIETAVESMDPQEATDGTSFEVIADITDGLMSRISRAQMLKLKEQEFVLASRTLGASSNRIIFKEILPNIISQLITNTMFSIPNAIFTEAFLSFVGLGIPTPMCSLGSLISDAYKSFTTHPYQIIPPVLVLALLMLCFNLLGDGLRDAFDPKMKQM